ncbi:MAG TPA: alpha/beta fold hydrolase [Kofleriaceae bacterium]|nr:alpha/beta fold hydrolase [Kofleriaceae bacterium]
MTAGGGTTEAWLPGRRPRGGTALRLITLPYAGGDTAIFAPWAEELPYEIELCPVQLPGRGRRAGEPAYAAIGPLVGALAGALAEALPPALDLPFALFGHSMGALVGFELARELRRRGLPEPCHLLVSAHAAPHLPRRYPPLSALPDDEFVAALHRRYGYVVPQDAGPLDELMRLMIPTLRSDVMVTDHYVLAEEEPLACPITAFGGLDDPTVTRDELAAWQHQTRGGCETRMLPGGHFYLDTDPRFLIRFIADRLRGARAA